MVDFNAETTVGTPASDVIRILILQRRADLFEAWEHYKKQGFQGIDSSLAVVRARLFTLWLELQAGLKRRLKDPEYKAIEKLIKSDDEQDIMQAIYTLNEELDKIKLTQIDTKKQYDKTRVESEHKQRRM